MDHTEPLVDKLTTTIYNMGLDFWLPASPEDGGAIGGGQPQAQEEEAQDVPQEVDLPGNAPPAVLIGADPADVANNLNMAERAD